MRTRRSNKPKRPSGRHRGGARPRSDDGRARNNRKEQQYEKDEEDQKKINGYLVVKFNARELREYEGTALGEYGVIDAELYTGILDIDRGAMEYDNAGSMEEAVELARGLESELDTEEPEVKVTIVKETDETTEEEEVDAQQMIAGWENTLRGQVASPHYKDVDARTAAHELYGYKAALRDLGLLGREDCFVLPDTFGAWPGREERTTFEHLHPELKRHRETAQIYALGLALAADCPPNDCRVYLNIFNGARELDAALDNLDAEGAPRTGRRAGGDVRRELRRQAVSEGGESMNGLDLFRSPKTAADEIADIVSAQCPPVVPENCDAFSCRECWLAWLTTGEPPKEKGPSDKQTAPGRDSAPYYPPTEAIRKAAERLKDGNMEYTAIALIRAHDGEELPQP